MLISRSFVLLLGCAVVTLVLNAQEASAQAQATNTTSDASVRCEALKSVDFSTVRDAITHIQEAKHVPATESSAAYCEVSGIVSSRVGFLIRLPTDEWNGKFIEIGCGGPCGNMQHISSCEDPLERGYACIVSDGGTGARAADMKWAYNNSLAVLDLFVSASHVTALAGKAIVERYYAKQPQYSYFMGCSTGGMQGMFEAQRFPWDFDGIVAGAPDISLSGVWISWLWGNRALHDHSGRALLVEADIELLHQAVMAKCEMDDGIKDGLIADPRTCRFDPAELRCTARRTTQCLTTQQVQAVNKLYGGAVNSKGEQIALPTAMRGSERTWLDWFGGSAASPTPVYDYVSDWFRYANFQPNPGSTWNPDDFSFDRDYKRLGIAESWDPQNPDLRRFQTTGGKILMYFGWNDSIAGVTRAVDYYETAERIIGSRTSTQDFLRLFVIPGMNHCSGGAGAYAIDYLSAIEDWVEKEKPPEKLIGTHLKDKAPVQFPLDPANVEFSRPIYPYPLKARYSGRGDPKDAASFRPAGER